MTEESTPAVLRLDAGLGAWLPTANTARLPDFDVPVWLYLPDGPRIIQGCRSDVGDGWAWCNCYGDAYFDGDKWKADSAEFDDDYQPSLWQPLPDPPRYTQSELDAANSEAAALVASLKVE